MNDHDWNDSHDPQAMLRAVAPTIPRRATLLFAVANARRFATAIRDLPTRAALDVMESFADGTATSSALREALAACPSPEPTGLVPVVERREWEQTHLRRGREAIAAAELLRAVGVSPHDAAGRGLTPADIRRVTRALNEVENRLARHTEGSGRTFVSFDDAKLKVRRETVAILRDVMGIPSRPAAIEPRWRTWNGGVVVDLAKAVSAEAAWDRMPILADALQEAGCLDQDMLNHCRSRCVHVRGCWVIDAILEARR
jgi:hypothetical protein